MARTSLPAIDFLTRIRGVSHVADVLPLARGFARLWRFRRRCTRALRAITMITRGIAYRTARASHGAAREKETGRASRAVLCTRASPDN